MSSFVDEPESPGAGDPGAHSGRHESLAGRWYGDYSSLTAHADRARERLDRAVEGARMVGFRLGSREMEALAVADQEFRMARAAAREREAGTT